MKLKRYNIINSENEIIKTIVAKSKKDASIKLQHLMKSASYFLRIEYKEKFEL